MRPGGRLVIVDGAAWLNAAITSAQSVAVLPFDDGHYRRPLTEQGFQVTTHQAAVGPTMIAIIVATLEVS